MGCVLSALNHQWPVAVAVVCGALCIVGLIMIRLCTCDGRRVDNDELDQIQTGCTPAPATGGSVVPLASVIHVVREEGRVRRDWNLDKGAIWEPIPPLVGVGTSGGARILELGIAIVCSVVIIALCTNRRANKLRAAAPVKSTTWWPEAHWHRPRELALTSAGVIETVWEGGKMRKYWNPEKGIMWVPLPRPAGISNEHSNGDEVGNEHGDGNEDGNEHGDGDQDGNEHGDGDEVGVSIYHYLFSK